MRLIFLWTHFISWYTSTLAIATRPPPNENDTCTPAPMKMAEDQTTYGCGTKRPPPKTQASLLAHILNSTVCQQPRSADCRHY